jgi:COP9 signalosome complex subunit 3
MDDLLPVLLSFPPHPLPPTTISDLQYDAGIRAQVENVRKVSMKNLLQTTSSGEHMLNVGFSSFFGLLVNTQLLQVINPTLNTVPYVFVLLANIATFQSQANNTINSEVLWQKIVALLENLDPRQIRYVGQEFIQVIAATANLARRAQQVCAYAIISFSSSGSADPSLLPN